MEDSSFDDGERGEPEGDACMIYIHTYMYI
jgi:hypothetical protein